MTAATELGPARDTAPPDWADGLPAPPGYVWRKDGDDELLYTREHIEAIIKALRKRYDARPVKKFCADDPRPDPPEELLPGPDYVERSLLRWFDELPGPFTRDRLRYAIVRCFWRPGEPCPPDHDVPEGCRYCPQCGTYQVQPGPYCGGLPAVKGLARLIDEMTATGGLPGEMDWDAFKPKGHYSLRCQFCGKPYTSKRAYSRTCSDNCRQKLSKRNRKARQASQTAGVFT